MGAWNPTRLLFSVEILALVLLYIGLYIVLSLNIIQVIRGRWKEDDGSAAGCSNFERYLDNPRCVDHERNHAPVKVCNGFCK